MELSLREKLLSVVDDFEAIIKQLLENMLMEKKTGEHHFCFGANLTIPELIRIFNKKQNELNFLLAQVKPHAEREESIRSLEKSVTLYDDIIKQTAYNLKCIETALSNTTYQAEKKLQSVLQSETNRVFSEDVIRLAHLISKSDSVSSSPFWKKGDQSRPFPTEAEFARSFLMQSHQQPHIQPTLMHQITTGRNTSLMPRVSSTGAIKSMTLPFNMPQQKSFTPSPRAGARMTSPSQRFGSPTSNTNPRKQMQRIPPGAQIARAAFVFSPLKAQQSKPQKGLKLHINLPPDLADNKQQETEVGVISDSSSESSTD